MDINDNINVGQSTIPDSTLSHIYTYCVQTCPTTTSHCHIAKIRDLGLYELPTNSLPPTPPQASQGAYAGSSEGPVARAVHKCRDAVNASPSSHMAQYHLGRLLLLTGQPSQALPHLRAALGIKPTHTESRCVCGGGSNSVCVRGWVV